MINAILGTKVKMTQTFVNDERVPVTVVKVEPNTVTQVKTSETDSYNAIQIATGSKKVKNTTKPLQGHLKGAIKDNRAPQFLREVRVSESDLKQGDKVNVTDVLSKEDMVAVTSTSKGKGFAGGIKRWGFAGGPKTHGQSDRHRAPGSIGQGTTPGRVHKGKKMAGRLGSDTKTVKNLQIIDVNPETNEIMIKGAVPGANGSLIFIQRIGEMKNPIVEQQVAEPETQEEVVNTEAQNQEALEVQATEEAAESQPEAQEGENQNA